MPENMASHWNEKGEVNGYMPKIWGLFLVPIISFVLFLLFVAIPKIDPLKKNIEKFRKYFDTFMLLIILFLFYVYLLTIFWNLGLRFNFFPVLVPVFSFIIYYSGVLIENSKRNWFIGVRTPWTLSNDEVWNKTNKLGGKLFKIAAIFALIGIIFGNYAIYFVISPIIIASFYTIVYSYLEYQKQIRKAKK
jgi:uncharacterized membrane protein